MAACRAVIGLLSVRALGRWSGAVWHARVQPQACPGCRARSHDWARAKAWPKGTSRKVAIQRRRRPSRIVGPGRLPALPQRAGRLGLAPPADRDELVEESSELTLDVHIAVRSPDDAESAIPGDAGPHPAARPVERDGDA